MESIGAILPRINQANSPARDGGELTAQNAAYIPDYVSAFVGLIQSEWPAGSAPEWSKRDDVAYGRQVIRLTREQVRELYYRLREKHEFRPSVAAVHAAAEALVPLRPAQCERPAVDVATLRARRLREDQDLSRPALPPPPGSYYGRAGFEQLVRDLRAASSGRPRSVRTPMDTETRRRVDAELAEAARRHAERQAQ